MELKFMEVALKESYRAKQKNEVPVGAVIVKNKKIISKAHNMRVKDKKVLSHAEIIAILKANKNLKDWRLSECDMYVTLKPCEMCQSIIKESRIKNVYYLLEPLKAKQYYNKTKTKQLFDFDEKKTKKYREILKNFFENMR